MQWNSAEPRALWAVTQTATSRGSFEVSHLLEPSELRWIQEVLTWSLRYSSVLESELVCVCVCVLLTNADSVWGIEDEPRLTHTAIAPPGVHTDPVLTQPRLEALIHIYTHTYTHFVQHAWCTHTHRLLKKNWIWLEYLSDIWTAAVLQVLHYTQSTVDKVK